MREVTATYRMEGPTRAERNLQSNVPRDEPDLLCVKPDRVLWLELKTAKGKLSLGQWQWYHEADAEGYEVHVIRSVEELRAVLGLAGGKNA